MSNLIIFYSRANTTKKVAEFIQEQVGGELLQIIDKKNRQGALSYLTSAVEGVMNADTEIEYPKVNLQDYDTIYLGTPVWASSPSIPVKKFLKENDFNNTNVVTFATMKSGGDKSTTNKMNETIKEMGGNVLFSFGIKESSNLKEETIKALERQGN